METSARPDPNERKFLEGPRPRKRELGFLLRVAWEFFKGFRALHFAGPCVTVFGSARLGEGHPYYALARELGAALARLGFTVMTGGGPGIMEAANRGAREAGGRSVGCKIALPHEPAPNPYLDRWVGIRYFFVRKVLLFKYSYAFVVLPGGVGTVDESFEAYTLIQNGVIADFPIVLMVRAYWEPLIEQLHEMAEEGTISPKDLELVLVTDSVEEAVAHIERHAVERFHLRRPGAPRARRALAER